jgi:hypothetical protein
MRHWINGGATLALATVMLAGCAGGEPTEGDEDGYVTSTVVELDARGAAHVVSVERVSAVEMQRQLDARAGMLRGETASGPEPVGSAAQALTADSGCGQVSRMVHFGHIIP